MADHPSQRLTLRELATQVLATTDSDEQLRFIAELSRRSRTDEQIVAVANRFLGHGTSGRSPFLEWVSRVRGAVPATVLTRVTPLLSDETLSIPTRVAAAAKVLKSLPDTSEVVRPITHALTAGLSPLRALERLRQLQHQLEKSRSLDALIDRKEGRVKMDCPRCGVRLLRIEMLRHLWNDHALVLEHGKVRTLQWTVEELKAEHSQTHDTTILDRAATLAGPGGLRAWVARADLVAEDTAPLLATASERGAGLCPGCFGELPPLAPLPPPLALANGHLAGDGYLVEVGGPDWLRTLTVAEPGLVIRSGPDLGRAMAPRGAASVIAGVLLLLAIGAAVVPHHSAPLLRWVFGIIIAATFAYLIVRIFRKPLPDRSERAVDAAWTILTQFIADRKGSTRYLTRLCRTSLGRGDPHVRVALLNRIIAWVRPMVEDNDLRLLATALLLQVDDSSRLGRDRVNGVAALIATGLTGERPSQFGEYVAEAYLDRTPPPDPGERARLRILLLDAAFDAGLKPRDILDLFAAAPNLRRAMVVEPVHRLGLLYGVWSLRNAGRWERIAPADSVYELCRSAPNISGRVLLEYPDLLLYHRPTNPTAAEELGPVLICARGVVVGGVMASDPYTEVEVVKAGRFSATTVFVFGPHRLSVSRPPADEFSKTVSAWLRFRVTALLPFIDRVLEPGPPEILARVLWPFRQRCSSCGTISAVILGRIGVPQRDPGT
jgi:predicted RNA-binding Zn-ribbon protein involved in translation (DUF1610 family)